MSLDLGTLVAYLKVDASATESGAAQGIAAIKALGTEGESAATQAGRSMTSGLEAGLSGLSAAIPNSAGGVVGDINQVGSQGGSAATSAGREISAGLESGLSGLSSVVDGVAGGVRSDISRIGSEGGSEARSSGGEISAGLESGLGGLGDSLDGATGGMLGKIKEFGSSGAGKATVAGAAIGAALVASLVAAMDFQEGQAKLQAQLDLTADESARVGKIAGDLYGQGFGESISELNGILAGVITNISGLGDASDAELQKFATFVTTLVTVTGEESERVTATVGRLIKTGLAKDAQEAFDMLTKAAQKTTTDMRGDLLDVVGEYSTYFESLGISGTQALGLIADASADGAIAMDKAGDSIKEFTIRSTDMSSTSVAAYGTIGLSAKTMAGDILAGGETARSAFDKIIGGLVKIKDPTIQANTAIALFGTPLEDLGISKIPGFLKSLDSASTGLGVFNGQAQKATDQANDTANSGLSALTHQLELTAIAIGEKLLPFAESTIGFLNDMTPALGFAVGALTPFIEAISFVGDGLKWVGESMGSTMRSMAEALGIVEKVVGTVQGSGIGALLAKDVDYSSAAFRKADEAAAGLGKSGAFMGEAILDAKGGIADLAGLLRAANPPLTEMEQGFKDGAQAAADFDLSAKGLTDSIDRMLGINKSAEQVEQDLNDAMRDGKKAFDDATKATEGHIESLINADGSINTVTEAGSKWKDSLDKQREAADASTASALALGLKNGDLGTAFAGARSAADNARAMFIENNKGMDGGVAAAGALADKLGIVEGVKLTDKELTVIANGIEKSKADIDSVNNKAVANKYFTISGTILLNNSVGKAVHDAVNSIGGYTGGSVAALMGYAQGGLLPGVSPVDPTMDNLLGMVNGKPIKVRSGEFIQPEPSVDYYGVQAMTAIQQRRVPREVLAGYAGGGCQVAAIPRAARKWFSPSKGTATSLSSCAVTPRCKSANPTPNRAAQSWGAATDPYPPRSHPQKYQYNPHLGDRMTDNKNLETTLAFIAAMKAAKKFTDPNLSVQRINELRAEGMASAHRVASGVMNPRAAAAAQQYAAAKTKAQSSMKAPENLLIRQEQAWKKAMMLLESGRDLQSVIASTNDPEILKAIADWGPTYEQSRQAPPTDGRGFTEPETSWIGEAVIDRLADLEPEPGAYVAVRQADAANKSAAAWDGLVTLISEGNTSGPKAYEHLAAIHAEDPAGYRAINDALSTD
ncbi:hypothetical protein EH165_00975 [Nakamurella antarctica]|uniref:Phage tail tape measure protein domain-containing protein n=1 Tax=Nakamurella antarctica TaxID=1902245 RepID=A0A3G8ZQX0_9ACTN|nr:phage tail tape measure protein [Nakamurella antarctica]AZI56954.1 hypothetical protein EH165_00975 [Nakamurella antarctica]